MARILAISSQVVSGHVGLSAIVPALQRLGHDVLPLPTILLSNHPGTQPASGSRIDADVLNAILVTLQENGRLAGIDAVLTGYLPSVAHVDVARKAIERTRAVNPGCVVVCDPVIGDDPKGVYIEVGAAAAIRDTLVPAAQIITPNRFELDWLSGRAVGDTAAATEAARSLRMPLVVATSIPGPDDRLATLAITAEQVAEVSVPRRDDVPNGTGDLLAALFLSEYLASSRAIDPALAASVSAVARVLDASQGRNELILTGNWWRGMATRNDAY